MKLYQADRHDAMAATYGSHDAKICGEDFLAWTAVLRGRTDEAASISDHALALARNLGHPFSLTQAEVFAAEIGHASGDPIAAGKHAAAAMLIAREQDFRLMFAWASILKGWATVEEGQTQLGLDQIGSGIASVRSIGNNSFLSYFKGLHAAACLKSGQTTEGLRRIDDALGTARGSGERFWESELYRLRGELQLTGDCVSAAHDAEQAFRQAIEVARSQGAVLLMLRAAVSLGKLLRRLGRIEQARPLLAEACECGARPDLTEVIEARMLIGAPTRLGGSKGSPAH